MKLRGDWSHAPDATDVLPEELRRDALRRRRIRRVGGAVVMGLLIAIWFGVGTAGFVAKVWVYGSAYKAMFGSGR